MKQVKFTIGDSVLVSTKHYGVVHGTISELREDGDIIVTTPDTLCGETACDETSLTIEPRHGLELSQSGHVTVEDLCVFCHKPVWYCETKEKYYHTDNTLECGQIWDPINAEITELQNTLQTTNNPHEWDEANSRLEGIIGETK